MSTEKMTNNRRLLESLEYIDSKYVDEMFEDIKAPVRNNGSADEKITWKTPFKHWKPLVALAACILLLSIASPLVSYIAQANSNFNAGAGSGTEEVNSDSESQPLYELFPDYSPTPLSEERIEELSKVIPALASDNEWTQYAWRVRNYLGDFNGCFCFYSDGHLQYEETKIIAGYEFTRSTSFTLQVAYNGTIMYMNEAYELGYLTQDEIGMMAAYHARLREGIVVLEQPETTTPLYNLFPHYVPEPLDATKKKEIENLLGENIGWYHNDRNFLSIFYLGTFNDMVVMSKFASLERLYPRTIAGYDFYIPEGSIVIVYTGNEIIDLETAYLMGLITEEQIGLAASVHDRLRLGLGYKKEWEIENNCN